MTREDLEALRTPLIALAMTLIVAAGVILYSGSLHDGARRLLAQRETQLKDARLRIQNAGEEKDMISRYVGAYHQLARAGFVGEEQRINWLDGLRTANDQARTSSVEYDIGAQKSYAYAAEFNVGQLQLNESIMQLRFRLLHEEDLPRFFEALARSGGGFFTVDRCVMRRLRQGEGDRGSPMPQNLFAECDVRWLTVRPPAIAEKKG